MKKLISTLISSLFIVSLFAQTITPESQKLIESVTLPVQPADQKR